MSLHTGIFIPLTFSCSLETYWGRTDILSSKAVELKPLELLGTEQCHLFFLRSSAPGEFCCAVMCMISGVRLCSYTGEINWGDHGKNTSPLLFFLLPLLLNRITFMFLFLKMHILMKKVQSMLVKQPPVQRTFSK